MSPGRDVQGPDARPVHSYTLDWVRAAWPKVKVQVLSIEPHPAGRRVRAAIQLGGLCPADVLVGLTAEGREEAETCPPDRCLWSSEALGNGAFVFERLVPAGEAPEGAEWTLCIRPSTGPIVPPLTFPLRLETAGEEGDA